MCDQTCNFVTRFYGLGVCCRILLLFFLFSGWVYKMLFTQKLDKTCLNIFGHEVWRTFSTMLQFLSWFRMLFRFFIYPCGTFVEIHKTHTGMRNLMGSARKYILCDTSPLKLLRTFFIFWYTFNFNNISCSLSKSIYFLFLLGWVGAPPAF